jgi:hypothetical protein
MQNVIQNLKNKTHKLTLVTRKGVLRVVVTQR